VRSDSVRQCQTATIFFSESFFWSFFLELLVVQKGEAGIATVYVLSCLIHALAGRTFLRVLKPLRTG
jgi:hypothetical protein